MLVYRVDRVRIKLEDLSDEVLGLVEVLVKVKSPLGYNDLKLFLALLAEGDFEAAAVLAVFEPLWEFELLLV